MIVVDGYIGNDPEFRTPARLYIEAANANIAGMQQQLYFPPTTSGVRAGADGHLHAEPRGAGLPRRPADRGRPRERRHARLQLRLLRRVEEGRAADVEQARLRPGRPGAARRLQGHPDGRRRAGRPDRRPVRHGQDDDDVHAPERLAAGAGRLRRADARRRGLRDRERLLREDLRAQPGRRADDLRRGHAARRVPRERLAERRRQGRLLRHVVHAERPRDVPVRGHRVGRRRPIDRARLPADPQPEREHHPGRRASSRARRPPRTSCSARRRDERRRRRRGGQVPARARHEPVLPAAARPPGQPLPRAARGRTDWRYT